jgi:hypothetical protein
MREAVIKDPSLVIGLRRCDAKLEHVQKVGPSTNVLALYETALGRMGILKSCHLLTRTNVSYPARLLRRNDDGFWFGSAHPIKPFQYFGRGVRVHMYICVGQHQMLDIGAICQEAPYNTPSLTPKGARVHFAHHDVLVTHILPHRVPLWLPVRRYCHPM